MFHVAQEETHKLEGVKLFLLIFITLKTKSLHQKNCTFLKDFEKINKDQYVNWI